jgi:hypothetical protein
MNVTNRLLIMVLVLGPCNEFHTRSWFWVHFDLSITSVVGLVWSPKPNFWLVWRQEVYMWSWILVLNHTRLVLPQVPTRLILVWRLECLYTYQPGGVYWFQCEVVTADITPCTSLYWNRVYETNKGPFLHLGCRHTSWSMKYGNTFYLSIYL